MNQLIETRWTRYGKDRVYGKTANGEEVGHVDLLTRSVAANAPSDTAELLRVLARWTTTPVCGIGPDARASTETEVARVEVAVRATTAELSAIETGSSRDLATNVAGAAARSKRNEVNAQAPIRNFVARLLDVNTEERAWRVGAHGEVKVGRQLAQLGGKWKVLHSVEVGSKGSDIDHIVVGPPGVFTLNTKCHPRANAWVGENLVMVNGDRTQYLRNSRFEARRASRLLSAALQRPVSVTAAIVFVDLGTFTVKQLPRDVHVTTCRRLRRWLRSQPATIDATTVEEIYAKARLSRTWTSAAASYE